MPHRELARRLSGGLTYGEIPAFIKNMVVDTHTANDFIMKPLPNHLFTRDTSCWIYNGVSINPMAKPARQRETNNLRAIYRWHPAFADGEFIKYFGDENINYDHATLEGGDVLVIGRGAVLIGMSERTTPQGVEFLANSLFKHRRGRARYCSGIAETPLLHAPRYRDDAHRCRHFLCLSRSRPQRRPVLDADAGRARRAATPPRKRICCMPLKSARH